MNWQLVTEAKAIFEQILDSPIENRRSLLEQRCPGDSALRKEVELLLAGYESRTILSTPLPELLSAADRSPRTLGPYQIVRPLGQGGMGRVYLALRADGLHNQEVAIKVIDRALSTAETDLRIQREVRALAKLAHPNIVRFLDGGVTEDGLFYMVMEFVSGTPIDVFCDQRNLPERERLRIFLQLCDAVSYAHRNLIIHRDIKPSNVLVTTTGEPKLLDFGIAKLLDDEPSERFTRDGFNRLTVEYASPEQLRADASVSTASDIYSLGVLLYEILLSRPPYRFRGPLHHEIVTTILEDEPVRPTLDRELTAIVMTALRKEPDRRYASVDYFRDDIVRYLAGQPVKAFRDSRWYRFVKLVRRRRTLLAGVAVSAFAVLIAAGVAVYQGRRASTRFEDVRTLADTVVVETQVKLFGLPGALLARVYVQKMGVDFLERLLADSPRDEKLIHRLIYSLLMHSGGLSGVDGSDVGDTVGAQKVIERALELAERQWRANPNRLNTTYLAQTLYYLGRNLQERLDAKGARAAFLRAVEIQEVHFNGSTNLEAQENLALAMSLLGYQCAADGEQECALNYHQRSLTIRESNVRTASGKPRWLISKRRRDVSIALYLFAASQHKFGLLTGALSTIDRAIAEEEHLLSHQERHMETRKMLAQRLLLKAEVQLALGLLADARKTCERSTAFFRELAADEMESWRYKRNLGQSLGVLARICEAQGDRGLTLRHLSEQLPLTAAAAQKDPASAVAQAEWEQSKLHWERLSRNR